jgi:hypothetical protein
MCHDQTGDAVRVTPSSKKRKAIVGRDRLTWRHTTDRRLLLCHGRGRNPIVTVEPDLKNTGMYRIRFLDGGLSVAIASADSLLPAALKC